MLTAIVDNTLSIQPISRHLNTRLHKPTQETITGILIAETYIWAHFNHLCVDSLSLVSKYLHFRFRLFHSSFYSSNFPISTTLQAHHQHFSSYPRHYHTPLITTSFTSIPYTLLSREWGRVECSIKQTSSHMSISLTPLVECLMEQTHPSQTLYHLSHSTTTAFTGIRISFTSLFSLIKPYRSIGLIVSTEVIWLVVEARMGCVVSDGTTLQDSYRWSGE